MPRNLMIAICSFIVCVAFTLMLPQGVLADSTCATPSAQCAEHQGCTATCSNELPCCAAAQTPSSEQSQPKGIGRLINNFFAFGCRVNYRLTNWILSDKCDLPRTSGIACPEQCEK